ncbi:kinase-like domain-containing protein [Biscogniauxia mediterranea]|nr:kinase-like domain-containing protein [Biscogniauxia mediterranea]
MSQERSLSDLVLDSKIVTTITPQYTEHIYHSPGTSASTRLVRRAERWVRDRPRAFIGQGSFGTVYRERCRGKVRAVKEIRKYLVAGEELDYTRELEAVVKFSHPKYAHCFVRSDGWFESIDAVFITMEYLEHGDLHRYLTRPLPEDEVKQITMQVLEGLNYMHQNGFAHRDLKPGNIMIVTPGPEWFVKIADFGISKRRIQDVTSLRTNRGTQIYQAPEMLSLGQNTQGDTYTFAVDMWSLGVVVYKMMTAMMPFPSLVDLFKYIDGSVDFPSDHLKAKNMTEDGIDFVIHLLSPQPAARLTAVSATEHAWMKLAYQLSVIGTLANGYVLRISLPWRFPTILNMNLQ